MQYIPHQTKGKHHERNRSVERALAFFTLEGGRKRCKSEKGGRRRCKSEKGDERALARSTVGRRCKSEKGDERAKARSTVGRRCKSEKGGERAKARSTVGRRCKSEKRGERAKARSTLRLWRKVRALPKVRDTVARTQRDRCGGSD